MEVKPEETNELVEIEKFKYRNAVKIPGSTRKSMENLRMIPFFIRLKIDLIEKMEVCTLKNSENMILSYHFQKKDENWNRELNFIEKTIQKEAENQRKDEFLVLRCQEYVERNKSTIGK